MPRPRGLGHTHPAPQPALRAIARLGFRSTGREPANDRPSFPQKPFVKFDVVNSQHLYELVAK
jgi:hypothetical protein